MKPIHFIRKYKLDRGIKFNHTKFAVDFGNDFQSRLELYKTYASWSHPRCLELMEEARKIWDNIDRKTNGVLPEKLWTWIYYNIIVPTKQAEFPEIAEQEIKIDNMHIGQLKTFLRNETKSYIGDVAMEWDHYAPDNAVGELNIRPNHTLRRLEERIYRDCSYIAQYAFEELEYQLTKVGYANAKVQFNMHRKRKHKSKKKFNYREWSYKQMFGIFDPAEYDVYFEVLGISKKKVSEKMINKAYRELSMKHHPDKGGKADKFVEITEAKNKCIEYLMITDKKKEEKYEK